MPASKPVLIYDGDCGFCRRWIERWRQITGDRIDYVPYQETTIHFPNITEREFQSSVQLVEPDGKVYRGAEAVFRSLATASSYRWLLGLYLLLGIFRFLSEKLYRLVAKNRALFSKFS